MSRIIFNQAQRLSLLVNTPLTARWRARGTNLAFWQNEVERLERVKTIRKRRARWLRLEISEWGALRRSGLWIAAVPVVQQYQVQVNLDIYNIKPHRDRVSVEAITNNPIITVVSEPTQASVKRALERYVATLNYYNVRYVPPGHPGDLYRNYKELPARLEWTA